MHSTPSAAKRSWMFATSRSRSWRRTNRLFSASSPNRTSRTTSLPPQLPITAVVINTALSFARRGCAPPSVASRPHLRGRVHLLKPRARRGPPLRADLPHADDRHRGVVRHQPPPPRPRRLSSRRSVGRRRPRRRGGRDVLHA